MDLDAARAALESVPADHEWSAWAWYWQELFEGEHDAALARLETAADGWIRIKIVARPTALLAALVHDLRGDHAEAAAAYGEAIRALENAVREEPADPRLYSSLGIARASVGRTDESIAAGRRAVDLFPMSKDAFYGVPQVLDLAHIYLLAGQTEAALDQLEYLSRVPSWISPAWLAVDPRWARLEGHERFEALLAGEG